MFAESGCKLSKEDKDDEEDMDDADRFRRYGGVPLPRLLFGMIGG